VAILIATSPIAAAGQVSEATKDWWPRLVAATIQLIVLKPVIALTFALGLTFTGEGKDIATILSGLLVLLLAVLAWPAIARFFTFASVQTGGGMGLAGLIGAASNTANARNGMPVGQDPNQFSQAAEARTMGAHAGRTAATGAGGAGAGAGGAGAGAAGQAGAAAGATAATGGAAAAVFAVKAGLDAAQKGANALVGKSEQMAGHAGLNGNPHAAPAGYPRHAPPQWPAQSTPPPTGEQEQPPDDPPSPPPAGDAEPPARGVSPVQHERPAQARVIEPGQPERGGTQ
jgi:hypothetical protein